MVRVKLWYWNFELTPSWSFFLQSSEILSFCIPLLTSENFFNGRGGVYTAAIRIRVTTKTVTCHSNSFLCIAVYFAAWASRRATLGARDFLCAVSGFGQVLQQTRAKRKNLCTHARKNLWYPGYRRACSQVSDNIISTNLTDKSAIKSFPLIDFGRRS